MSFANTGKHPPQFVFDIIVAQTTRAFLHDGGSPADLAKIETEQFASMYDVEDLEKDIASGIERFLAFIDSVEISDVDLLLNSFTWFAANYEDLKTARKKKAIFGSPLKGRPKNPSRVFASASLLKSYTYAVGAGKAPKFPADWTQDSEVEFEAIFSLLSPLPAQVAVSA